MHNNAGQKSRHKLTSTVSRSDQHAEWS